MIWPFGLLRKSRYGVIYADPPWRFEAFSGGVVPQRSPDQHYGTMSLKELADLPVAQLAAPDCALFMWGISSHLPQVLRLGASWGFEFKGKAFAWSKLNKNAEDRARDEYWNACASVSWEPDFSGPDDCNTALGDDSNWFMGLGYGTRKNTEDCWLFTRGNPKRLDAGVRELIVSPIREHSRKPDETYGRIERLFAGPRCELFARNSRPGWSSWGNETKKF